MYIAERDEEVSVYQSSKYWEIEEAINKEIVDYNKYYNNVHIKSTSMTSAMDDGEFVITVIVVWDLYNEYEDEEDDDTDTDTHKDMSK